MATTQATEPPPVQYNRKTDEPIVTRVIEAHGVRRTTWKVRPRKTKDLDRVLGYCALVVGLLYLAFLLKGIYLIFLVIILNPGNWFDLLVSPPMIQMQMPLIVATVCLVFVVTIGAAVVTLSKRV